MKKTKKVNKSVKTAGKVGGSKLRNIIISTVVCTIAAGSGIGLGITFGQRFDKAPLPQPPSDWLAYEQDERSLLSKYNNANGNYDSFEAYDLANIAAYIYEQNENHYSIVTGVAAAKSFGITVNQVIHTANIRNGDQLFCESISESKFAKPAYRYYENIKEDFITEYKGEIVGGTNGTKANWNTGIKADFDKPAFENKWGKTLDKSNIYIISEKTVLDSTKPVTRDDKGNYLLDIDLDPATANKRYIRQMISMSQPDGLPKFNSLNIKFTLDKDLKILEKVVTENYDITVGASANTKTTMTENFYYDSKIEIPSLDQDFNYGGK